MAYSSSAYADYMEAKTGARPDTSPSNFNSPYSGDIAQRISDVNSVQPYESPYKEDIANAWAGVRDRSPYTSKYDALLGELLDKSVNYGEYQDPYKDRIDKALGTLEGAQYESPYKAIIDEELAALRDRKFDYDMASDPVYQELRKSYLREADRTASDVLAKASAATGGRASSYAVSAASQAANYFKSQLSDRQQELFDAAYQRYLNEYSQGLGIASAYETRENQNYGQWADQQQRNQAMLDDLRALRGDDYSLWADEFERGRARLSDVAAMENQDYGRYLDEIAQSRADLETATGLDQQEMNRWASNYALLLDQLNALNEQYNNDYNRWFDERSDTYNRLVTAISSAGYNPTDAELALAGMTREEANKWLNYYYTIGYYSGGRSGSSGGRRSSGSTQDTGSSYGVPVTGEYPYKVTQATTPISKLSSNVIYNSKPLTYNGKNYLATTSTKNPVTISTKGLVQSTLNSGNVGSAYADYLDETKKTTTTVDKSKTNSNTVSKNQAKNKNQSK